MTLQLLKNQTVYLSQTLQPSDFQWKANLSMYEVVDNVTRFFLGNTLQVTGGYACQVQIKVGEEMHLITSDAIQITVKGYFLLHLIFCLVNILSNSKNFCSFENEVNC